MSDSDDFWRPPAPGDASSPPPPPPPAPTTAAPTPPPPPVSVTSSAIVGDASFADNGPGKKRRWMVGVASLAAVAILVSALVAVTRAGTDKGGASSAPDAAAALFEAIENEDLVALAELLHPGERRTLAEPGFDVLDELVRLELLDPSLDEAALSGIDISFDGLEYHLEPVPGANDMQELIVDAGTLNVSTDAAELPIGVALRDRFSEEISGLTTDESSTIDPTQPPEQLSGPIVVERDGRWYFSLWYTVAEEARRQSGDAAVPSLDAQPAAIGAESPEAAITGMINSAADLNFVEMIGMLDPEESAALYRYSPLFLEDASQAVDELMADVAAANVSWDITDIETTTKTDGDVAYVSIESFKISARAEGLSVDLSYSPNEISVDATAQGSVVNITVGINDNVLTVDGSFDGVQFAGELTLAGNAISGWATLDGERIEVSLTIDPQGECSNFELTGLGLDQSGCFEELSGYTEQQMALFAEQLAQASYSEFPGPTLVATRHDDKWFFSPSLTMSNALLTYLRTIDAETLATQLDQMQQMTGIDSGY